ncbi:putative capsid protein [Avon-Heathcote Estuary associated circular virus 10]|uniref:putative capsid protein n=1 Tax=Avon-Heathcote Estuary associated circular virus 10 TaxID=1618233 RepID=UPI0005CDB03D|nr:putative capsid protein [Avon-Heathcote Estuary associated circular virus 10]AJP36390.1 putative capsid protein [Avon-Heathcote Estuary associated circular virus 10]AJP36393.1 putative capsid protein [Avon-Heathcote Estuary associated circular virus 10]AJP36395.1 putative capsid protein [Avon-Heathcote Estuary associated circular virus 10]
MKKWNTKMPITSYFRKRRASSQARPNYSKKSKKNPYTRKRKASKYMKRAVAQAKSTARFNTQVKNVMLAMEETKYKTTNLTGLPAYATTMYHNKLTSFKLWEQGSNGTMALFPLQRGTDQDEIVGREYYAKSLKIDLQFTFPYDRLGSTIKVWYVPVKTGQPEPAYDEFFRNTSGNIMLDPRNMQNYPYAKYLGSFRPRVKQTTFGTLVNGNGVLGGRDATVVKSYRISFNKFFKLRSNVGGDAEIDFNDIPNLAEKAFLVFTAYNEEAALETDQVISNVEGAFTFSYKDP